MKKLCIVILLMVFFCSYSFAEDKEFPIEGKLSESTMIRNGVAYMQIPYQIVDDVPIYNDLKIIESMYPPIKKIEVFCHSIGGQAYVAFSIIDLFKRAQEKFDIEIYASGTVASAAVVIFCSFEKRYAGKNTYFLVHEIRGSSESQRGLTATDIKRMDNLYDRLTDRYISMLAKLSEGKLTSDEWLEKMKNDTWFSADEAFEWGLVTEVK
jgi:ATP-dependent protease ClpP protease subunit